MELLSENLYNNVCLDISKLTTKKYSTSFSLGIAALDKKFHNPIYAIYGFVRFADEIVDTFHSSNKNELLQRFKADTYKAIEEKISLNPILHSFQMVVNKYSIEKELIDSFLYSMEMDLQKIEYDVEKYKLYILGSAEVVGLMCLRVFCEGNNEYYLSLKKPAMQLGSAFQKINFLRDLKADFFQLGRTYFPEIKSNVFNNDVKLQIEQDILVDFQAGYKGIKLLPKGSRFGVYLAYSYYLSLFNKIKKLDAELVLKERIRVTDTKKYLILVWSYIKHKLNLI
ncbi:MAG: phytoene/squalene synthase family protein [Bacteroidota bacterium]|jgi:phytoene synthase